MNWEGQRRRMVDEQLRRRGLVDDRALAAIAKIPRHLFVEEAISGLAYQDKSLPIGEQQTISQPYMVAAMTEALELEGHERVLEIGTGSGYQTAVLAELAASVFSIERIATFAHAARKRLESFGYYNALVQVGDGTIGWREHAPFDAIIVTAGSPSIPRPLLDQLGLGGRLVAPVGPEDQQTLVRIWRGDEGFEEEELGACRFVKLVGRHGWPRE